MKLCKDCGINKRAVGKSNGRTYSYCKECKTKRGIEYYKNNKKSVSERQKKHYEENRDFFLEKQKNYRETNKESVAEYKKKYYRENPDRGRRQNARRRARKQENGYEFYTENQVLDMYGTDCHLCNNPIDLTAPRAIGNLGWEQGLHLDHVVPLSKGGSDTLENIRPAHGKCNIAKGSKID